MVDQQLTRFTELINQCPFLHIRTDSISIFYHHHYPNDKLVINTQSILRSVPNLELIKAGSNPSAAFLRILNKIKYVNESSSPPSLTDRIKYLGTPATYHISQILDLYNTVYGHFNDSEISIRIELARLCQGDPNQEKFLIPKSLWSTSILWPHWCTQSINLRRRQSSLSSLGSVINDQEEGYISLDLESDHDEDHQGVVRRQLGLSSHLSKYNSSTIRFKRSRLKSPSPSLSPSPLSDEDDTMNTDLPASILDITTLPTFTTRGILCTILDRTTSYTAAIRNISPKDLNHTVPTNTGRRHKASDFFPSHVKV